MKATCNWCNSIVDAPNDYDNRIMKCYCDENCREKDWLFMRWQSNERLTELAERARDEQSKEQ